MTTYPFTPSAARDGLRVVVVEDHPLMRRGITDVINESSGMRVCGEAGSVSGALAVIDSTRPDLATVDLSLGHESGLALVEAITARHPEVRCLVLSVHDELVSAGRALEAGAAGYLMKDRGPTELTAALIHIAAGGTYLSEAASVHVLSMLGGRGRLGSHPIESLTDRERHVLTLIGEGLSTRQISEQLHLSVKTVETHYAHIKEKLDLPHVRALVRFAVAWLETEWKGASTDGPTPVLDPAPVPVGSRHDARQDRSRWNATRSRLAGGG